jgi:Tfp pilus assembly protein PilF
MATQRFGFIFHSSAFSLWRRLALLLLLAVVATGAAAVLFLWHRYQAQQERTEALRAAHSGRFDDAEPLLRRALERNPDDLEPIKALALGHVGAGMFAEAEPHLSRWCALRPDDAEPFKQRMVVRHQRARAAANGADQQRMMAEAAADGLRALQLDPDDGPVAQEVIWLLLQVGRVAEADQLCRHWLKQQPDDLWLTYLLAKIDYARGATADARALLDALLQRHLQFTPVLLLRAVLYNEAGESDKAVPLLRQVLALDRDHPREARYQLSLALARTGQAEEAQRLMAEVQKDNLDGLLAFPHDPDAVGVKLQRAEACLGAGREEEALRLLAPVLEPAPGSAPAHALLADYYERKGQPERAAEHRRRAENPRFQSHDR